MSAVEVLRMARECGVRLGVAGADLILDADQEPTSRVLDAIRRHKAGIITLLTHRPEGAPPAFSSENTLETPTKRTDKTDRRAFVSSVSASLRRSEGETGSEIPAPKNAVEGVPPEWTVGVERLLALPRPDGVSPERWRALQDDAVGFVETWGVQAAKLGWETVDVFGVNITKPFVRLDAAGLVRLLDGRAVVALTESQAAIQCRRDNRLTFRRKAPGVVPKIELCLLWELPAMEKRNEGC